MKIDELIEQLQIHRRDPDLEGSDEVEVASGPGASDPIKSVGAAGKLYIFTDNVDNPW